MLKRLLLVISLLVLGVSFSDAQTPIKICVPSSISATNCIPVNSSNPFPITGSITANSAATATAASPSYVEGTSNVLSQNLTGDLRTIAKQSGTWTVQPGNTANTTAWLVTGTGGIFPATQSGTWNIGTVTTLTSITNPIAVTQSGTWNIGSITTLPALVASSAIIGNVRIDQTTPGTTNGVVISPTATAGIAPAVSTAAESNRVLKSGAGNLYTLTVTIGATSGYLMLFDATSLPGNGAVTPKYCYPINSNGTNGGSAFNWSPGPPLAFATGITAGFSTTGCFTLTASATGNFFGQFQ